jgi:UDP-2,3-diacylglucosamine pyrophosphatase LpxH
MAETSDVKRVRALLISDLHLGMRQVCIRQLIAFLSHYQTDTLYLVGDIVDGWKLQKAWRWPPEYNRFAQAVLNMAVSGTRVVYLPGNHDEFLREYLGTYFGEIELVDREIHTSATGKTYLVIHGDQFDMVVGQFPRLSHFGHWAYNLALRINPPINWVRRRLGLPYWSLSQWAKEKVKNSSAIKDRFEAALVREARESGVDGVICGHIHVADMHDRLGIEYLNCGDWVENCTAIAEHFDGTFELVRWPRELPALRTERRRLRVVRIAQ